MTDIRSGDWAARFAPAALVPYIRLARLDRPIGTWLLLFPGWWAIALAAAGWPDWRLMALFGIGARGDARRRLHLQRHRRPRFRRAGRAHAHAAAPERRGHRAQAVAVHGAAARGRRGRCWSASTGWRSCSASLVLLLIATYPLHEAHHLLAAILPRPQLQLGRADGLGGGDAASLGLPAFLLYVGGISWTLGYDTIYAHQDKEDDVLIGVKSSALALGRAHAAVALRLLCRSRSRCGAPPAGRRRSAGRSGSALVLVAAAARLAGGARRHRRSRRLPRQVPLEPPRPAGCCSLGIVGAHVL